MKQIVIGLGTVGSALLGILRETYEDVDGYDQVSGWDGMKGWGHHVVHIAFPWTPNFSDDVETYRYAVGAGLVIIHSTVPIGTSAPLGAVHSPVLGRPKTMRTDMRKYLKWLGGPQAEEAEELLAPTGFRTKTVPESNFTEALKLLDLAKYGTSIAFSHYAQEVCNKMGLPYSYVLEYDIDYNNHVESRLKRPIIAPLHDKIGGGCVIPGTKMLHRDFPHPLLEGVLKHG